MSATAPAPPQGDTLRVLFPTLVGEFWYPNQVAEKLQMIARIHELRAADSEGERLSQARYQNGYTSYFSRRDLYTDPVFANLVRFIRQRAHGYANHQNWDLQNFELVMSSLWCNINPRHSYHGDHIHPYSHISGVFYVSCIPESGAIAFKDPRPARWMVPPATARTGPENTLLVQMQPAEGKVLMFPAWLEHGVMQNPTDTDRISMSYNFEMRPKGG